MNHEGAFGVYHCGRACWERVSHCDGIIFFLIGSISDATLDFVHIYTPCVLEAFKSWPLNSNVLFRPVLVIGLEQAILSRRRYRIALLRSFALLG